MTDESDPFNGLDLEEIIDLRWTLRDIRAKRWKLSPINPSHLEKLKSMNLIEMDNDEPTLTKPDWMPFSDCGPRLNWGSLVRRTAIIIGATFVASALVYLLAKL